MSYEETIQCLLGLDRALGWDLKLDRVRAALALLGHPEARYPSVLIAGTNGKGSTAAMVHAIARATGARVGLYTSPHLVHFTERIRIDEREIDRQQVVDGVERVQSVTQSAGIVLTFFELTTVLMFQVFAEVGVDLAVLEVGLGGRLDATNVVEPEVSAVTSIGWDHEAFLGTTLAAIATEKAGVMRPARTVVVGPAFPSEAERALREHAHRLGTKLIQVDAHLPGALAQQLPLVGDHMRGNAAMAIAICEQLRARLPELGIDEGAIAAGLGSVRWPGRLHVVSQSPLTICDAAHNREGAEALVAALPQLTGGAKVRLLFGALADKPWRQIAAILRPCVSQVVATTVPSPRAVAASEIAAVVGGAVPTRAIPSPLAAFTELIAGPSAEPILVAGSLFLLGAIYEELLRQRGVGSVFEL